MNLDQNVESTIEKGKACTMQMMRLTGRLNVMNKLKVNLEENQQTMMNLFAGNQQWDEAHLHLANMELERCLGETEMIEELMTGKGA